jgi:ferrous iron transport protein B
MSKTRLQRIALIGNPNSGKSSLFNHLTGLKQRIGNFPGITVEKKSGTCKLDEHNKVELLDLPGAYSLYPRSVDERVVADLLIDDEAADHPDMAVIIVDASNIKRNLLLFTQVKDLGIPVILVLNMLDVATNLGQRVSPTSLAKEFGVPVISINARTGQGIDLLKKAMRDGLYKNGMPFIEAEKFGRPVVDSVKERLSLKNNYQAYLVAQQFHIFPRLSAEDKDAVKQLIAQHKYNPELNQSKEIIERYKLIEKVIEKAVVYNLHESKNFTSQLDRWFTHKVWGYVIFFGILFFIFQTIFAWATVPMDVIDFTFSELSTFLNNTLPPGLLTNLLTEGILPGIGGVLIFIPQIALLFAFVALLEESGYMARVVFLMDRLMRRFGLNGRSVVPLISGVACAIPAIMATRTIDNWKERLTTILVTPLVSCSARLPVYTILIALVVPEERVLGILNLQGLVLMGMYILGFAAAFLVAWISSLLLDFKERSYFIMELPLYKFPRWKNVGTTIYEKSKTFALEAGKIILAISIILWVLASFGPGDRLENAEQKVRASLEQPVTEEELEHRVENYKLENSYAGIFGKFIEPAIRPLGYDWKIGIALITSFAAREVFVGTMATIYSIGSDNEGTIKTRMKEEINPRTGGPMYTPAVAFSLLVFYAFAMQCMSTLAITKKETNGWKWPIVQLVYMSVLAYVASFAVYQLMS